MFSHQTFPAAIIGTRKRKRARRQLTRRAERDTGYGACARLNLQYFSHWLTERSKNTTTPLIVLQRTFADTITTSHHFLLSGNMNCEGSPPFFQSNNHLLCKRRKNHLVVVNKTYLKKLTYSTFELLLGNPCINQFENRNRYLWFQNFCYSLVYYENGTLIWILYIAHIVIINNFFIWYFNVITNTFIWFMIIYQTT